MVRAAKHDKDDALEVSCLLLSQVHLGHGQLAAFHRGWHCTLQLCRPRNSQSYRAAAIEKHHSAVYTSLQQGLSQGV